ncbi:MAG TPA: hypothetical protein VLB84_00945 [Bacteroidia bacterium]|jgi:hypothetical protein|nr:hypothetical protein [Bacteroidia bacterium]
MNKAFKILEIIWLILGIIGIVMCGYFILIKDNHGAIYFIIFTVVCGIMYSVRKRQRIRFENNQKNKSVNN